jgi:hypothetical protein
MAIVTVGHQFLAEKMFRGRISMDSLGDGFACDCELSQFTSE